MGFVNLLYFAAVVLISGCPRSGVPVDAKKAQEQTDLSEESAIDLQGAGATFPYPLYSKWVAEFEKVDPRVRINYQSIGSGGGIRQIVEQTIDFGASDAVMNDEDMARLKRKLLHIPMTMGAVVLAYNLPGSNGLKLSAALITLIFLGEIKSWDDPRLGELNPGLKVPAKPITVVYRSDGSGTTAIFSEYLATVSSAWKEKVGAGKSVKFPVGLGAKGNEGVSGQVRTTPGSLGYVELAYARQTGLSVAVIENKAGNFAQPNLESIVAAAEIDFAKVGDDLRLSIIDPPGPYAYPISAFSYILIHEEQRDPVKGKALVRFLSWAIHEGQSFGPALHYAPLPKELVLKIETLLGSVKTNG